jgi:hypothetical protein
MESVLAAYQRFVTTSNRRELKVQTLIKNHS